MKNIIVGTAGHIDHGKTSLVKALTGIDADRLEEEKRRGITIDLGFAHLQLSPSLRLGFVDVPGHERFVKNMLAGASGVDLVLFVIAADESIKPQTREHFDICRLLGIRSGVVALTKIDAADPDIAGLTRLEAEELVAGSFLEGAPIIPVSSVTGEGLPELRAALQSAAERISEKDAAGPFRLPIDRAFSIKGFGTVVTGTLISGEVEKEQEVELHPGGRRLRVRGIQVHARPAARARAGQRTALNLPGVEPAELGRGMTLTSPESFAETARFDCRLQLLPTARPLRHRAPVHWHAGTAELEADVRFFGGRQSLRPGETGFARITLRQPAVLAPGDPFIIRQFSPVITIGGGVVVEVAAHRYRRGEDAAARLTVLAAPELPPKLLLLAGEAPFGISIPSLARTLGIPAPVVEAAARLAGLTLLPGPGWLIARDHLHSLRRGAVAAVRAFHAAQPLQPGLARAELRGALPPSVPAALFESVLSGAPELLAESDLVRLRTHRVELQASEQQARQRIEDAFAAAGLTVPPLADVLAASGIDPARSRAVLQILLREKRLVRVSEDLVFHTSVLENLLGLLARQRGKSFGVTLFKDWTGLSRKYAIPLLEYLDREHVTRRQGEERIVL